MTGEYDRELLRSRLRDVRLGRVFRVIHRDRRTTPLGAAPAPSRFSDPQGRYAVLYASEAVRCAFWEVLWDATASRAAARRQSCGGPRPVGRRPCQPAGGGRVPVPVAVHRSRLRGRVRAGLPQADGARHRRPCRACRIPGRFGRLRHRADGGAGVAGDDKVEIAGFRNRAFDHRSRIAHTANGAQPYRSVSVDSMERAEVPGLRQCSFSDNHNARGGRTGSSPAISATRQSPHRL